MRIVLQRVTQAEIEINHYEHRSIQKGLVLLLGIEHDDNQEDADWLVDKVRQMRIFEDADGKMNLSSEDVNGEFLIVSQFTLHASTKKGNRPSFIKAARPETAIPLYEYFVEQMKMKVNSKVITGEFGAYMKINLINDGPVTIIIDSKNKE